MKPRLPPIAAFGVAMLAACSGVNSYNTYIYGPYARTAYQYAAAGRDFAVEVQGNPFGMDPAAFGEAVTAAMQGHNLGPRTHFTTTPGPSARPQYQVVVAFNPVGVLGYGALCQGRVDTAPVKQGERLRAAAAFCETARALTEAEAESPPVSGPDTPDFRAMMAGLTWNLFPIYDRDMRLNDDCPIGMLFC